MIVYLIIKKSQLPTLGRGRVVNIFSQRMNYFVTQLINSLMIEVSVEQPLASLGSANKAILLTRLFIPT